MAVWLESSIMGCSCKGLLRSTPRESQRESDSATEVKRMRLSRGKLLAACGDEMLSCGCANIISGSIPDRFR